MKQSTLERKFEALWNETLKTREDIDPTKLRLTSELQFARHLKRKYRFDFAHEQSRVAIELQGGVYNRGAHVRPEGYRNDCEKALLARELMWCTCALTSCMVTPEFINRIIDLILSRQFISGGHTDYVVSHISPNAFPNPYVRIGEPASAIKRGGKPTSRN